MTNLLIEKGYKETKWIFSSPLSPWTNGMVERMVRELKKGLYKNLPECVSESVLRTVTIKVEGILNSRPVTAVSNDSRRRESFYPERLFAALH
jgi:hypothetical protein